MEHTNEMTLDLDNLKRLALAATRSPGPYPYSQDYAHACQELQRLCHPDTILALVRIAESASVALAALDAGAPISATRTLRDAGL